MRPMQVGRFGFPPVRTMAAKLAIALLACSVVGVLIERAVGLPLLRLVPTAVLKLAVWQPITYIPLEYSPLGIIFGALILWMMGGALEMTWGSGRLFWFAVGTTFAAGLLTVALSLLVSSIAGFPYGGGTVMASIVWVAYGLSFGRRMTNFWGLPVSGNVLALIGVGFVALTAVFSGWQLVVPEVFALLLTFLYVRVGSPRVFWLRLQSWRLQRQLKARSRHLRVIGGERNMPGDSDRYLH
ncbi:MAG: rhomboid family intramembrane serine protease [Myxococcales bacterium]|nr:rhomboid family intramembrane serine protease [Myxococcales bacterium]